MQQKENTAALTEITDDEMQAILNKKTKTNECAICFFDWSGSVITFLAMVPMGGFGMLLCDYYLLLDQNEIFRFMADAVAFIATEEGKRRLIRYFKRTNFQGFGENRY